MSQAFDDLQEIAKTANLGKLKGHDLMMALADQIDLLADSNASVHLNLHSKDAPVFLEYIKRGTVLRTVEETLKAGYSVDVIIDQIDPDTFPLVARVRHLSCTSPTVDIVMSSRFAYHVANDIRSGAKYRDRTAQEIIMDIRNGIRYDRKP